MPHRYASFNMEYADGEFCYWTSTLTTNPWGCDDGHEACSSPQEPKHQSPVSARKHEESQSYNSCLKDDTEGLMSPFGQQLQLQARSKASKALSPQPMPRKRGRLPARRSNSGAAPTRTGTHGFGTLDAVGACYLEHNDVDSRRSQKSDRLSHEILERKTTPNQVQETPPTTYTPATIHGDQLLSEQDSDSAISSTESSSIYTIEQSIDAFSAYSWEGRESFSSRQYFDSMPSSITSAFRHRVDNKITRLFTDMLKSFSGYKEQTTSSPRSSIDSRDAQKVHDYDSIISEPWVKINYESPRARRFGFA